MIYGLRTQKFICGFKMRLIPRIDIKNEKLIKGIQLEGLRVLGDPHRYAKNYYLDGVDELLLMDCVASLYDRNGLDDFLMELSEEIFIPVCAGGGIRTVKDVEKALTSGADKVAVNTAAIKNINIVTEMAVEFGSQAIVGSIETKLIGNKHICFFDNGREQSTHELGNWIVQLETAGIGELLVTSVDLEGTKRGYDKQAIETSLERTTRPLIYCGGIGSIKDLDELNSQYGAELSGISVASILHYKLASVADIIGSIDNG